MLANHVTTNFNCKNTIFNNKRAIYFKLFFFYQRLQIENKLFGLFEVKCVIFGNWVVKVKNKRKRIKKKKLTKIFMVCKSFKTWSRVTSTTAKAYEFSASL